jgi:hypothetical protein
LLHNPDHKYITLLTLVSNMQVMAQRSSINIQVPKTEVCVNQVTKVADTSILKFKISHPSNKQRKFSYAEGHLTSHMWVATLPRGHNNPIQTQ